MKIKLRFTVFVLVIAFLVSGCAPVLPERYNDALEYNEYMQGHSEYAFVAGIYDVLYALENPGEWVVLDVRSRAEFEGVPGSSAGTHGEGRIAGAVNIEWSQATDENGQLLPEEELREIFSEVLDGRSIIVYCRSGARSSHTWEVLNSLGASVLNFEGSWIEWSFAASAYGTFPDKDLVLSFTEAWTEVPTT